VSRARDATHEQPRGLENPRPGSMRRALAQTRDLSTRQLLTTNHDCAATTIRVYQGDQPSIWPHSCVALRARPPDGRNRSRSDLTRSRHIRAGPKTPPGKNRENISRQGARVARLDFFAEKFSRTRRCDFADLWMQDSLTCPTRCGFASHR